MKHHRYRQRWETHTLSLTKLSPGMVTILMTGWLFSSYRSHRKSSKSTKIVSPEQARTMNGQEKLFRMFSTENKNLTTDTKCSFGGKWILIGRVLPGNGGIVLMSRRGTLS